ncbi:E3 ubiquitin-protein ligase RNF166 [Patella vulgata]|uniref:E3 ubiquitin-protein ligase RNF166 n=1 Tax=Patella vulgata TaxID=6465 RepID=UPI0021806B13|nr:E3 ubiquitin-protein ligase RNF166 [Patella vulgata]
MAVQLPSHNPNHQIQGETNFTVSDNESADQFTCSICLEIFLDPVKITCGNDHVYCAGCLQSYQNLAEPQCPQCRNIFNPSLSRKASDIHRKLKSKKADCKWCQKKMTLNKIREHLGVCDRVDRSIPQFKPVRETSQPIPSNVPNRATFKCPYCGQPNLDVPGMVKHCNDNHRQSAPQVVCPICASMPWGDANHTSTNFIQHLNLRHRFEYDTYVDYNQDDDAMLQAALQASMATQ